MRSCRGLAALGVLLGCAPQPQIRLVDLPVVTDSVFVQRVCSAAPCASPTLEPIAPSPAFKPLVRNFQLNPIVISCGWHVTTLVVFDTTSFEASDGGLMRGTFFGATFDGGTLEVRQQYGPRAARFATSPVLFELRTDGRQDLPSKPTVEDGGLRWARSFDYEWSDGDAGLRITEHHFVSLDTQVVEERFSDCLFGEEPFLTSQP